MITVISLLTESIPPKLSVRGGLLGGGVPTAPSNIVRRPMESTLKGGGGALRCRLVEGKVWAIWGVVYVPANETDRELFFIGKGGGTSS